MRVIRFDKKSERSHFLQTNKYYDIYNMTDLLKIHKIVISLVHVLLLMSNCFRRRLSIDLSSIYQTNKPDKFGIKFWLCDVNNKYIINGFSYLGKDERRKYLISLEEFIVLKLMEPFIRCIKNVITDNFFRSGHKVAKNTTIVGTIRGNKRELAKLAKERKDKMTLFSSKLYKSNYICLIAYKSKPTKKKCLC